MIDDTVLPSLALVIADLRALLDDMRSQRDEAETRARELDDALGEMTRERDALLDEVGKPTRRRK